MVGRRLPTLLLGGFALLAMLLACAGIYGVLSFVTAKRTQELGIRAALGASRWDLVPHGDRQRRHARGRGHRDRPRRRDRAWASPGIDAVPDPHRRRAHADRVGVLFLTVALLACFVPAWRAARIDPMSALRQE